MDFVHLTQPCSMVLLLIVVPVTYNFMGIKNEYANQMDSGLDKYHHVDVRKATLYNFLKLLLTQPLTVVILGNWLMDNGSFLGQLLVKWSHTFVIMVSN